MRRKSSSMASSGGLDDADDSAHDALELPHLAFELFAPRRRKPVITGAAVVFGLLPIRRHPTLDEHSLEGRVERAFFDQQHFARHFMDVTGDAVAVHWSESG